MTFCLGMNLKDGLVGIADTRVTTGNEYITARKLSTYDLKGGACFLMTSGLRSVRDKTITYFERLIATREEPFLYTYEAVNALASCMRQVAEEDKAALHDYGTTFCINILFGGRFKSDTTHKLYKIYSEGNWVEIGVGTPYHIIGASGYGKPILDRTLKHTDPVSFALKVGCLAFDSTRISAADVGLPVDIVIFRPGAAQRMVCYRYEAEDFREISVRWQARLRNSIDSMDSDWLAPVIQLMQDEP
jgi:putative proteasome-type protease